MSSQPAREIRTFSVTVPAGTTIANPQVTNLTMPARQVLSVHVRVPPGPRGEVGWSLGSRGVHVLPYDDGHWIITDDDKLEWPVYGQFDSGDWSVSIYNTGLYSHTLYFTFMLDVVTQGAAPLKVATNAALSS